MVLHITLSREKSINDKSPVMFVLATVYRPPGHHTDFIKEFADFLSELVLAADKVLIVGDFNIHVDNEKDALGSASIDILNSIGVRQHVSGPTHCRNHTLDLILSHGIDVNGVEILQQSDDISDHYLVLCKLHIVKAVIQLLLTNMVEPLLLPQKIALQVIFLIYLNSSAYPTAQKNLMM